MQISARYVSALFEVATSASALDSVEKDLSDLANAIQSEESLSEFIKSPLLNRSQQAKIIAALSDSFKAHKVTKEFLVALAGARRLSLLPEAAKQFSSLAEASRGELSAELVTATSISDKEAQEVAEHLGKAYGKKIKLRTSQDKTLLGGVVVKIGGVHLDSSIAGKLERMNLALKAA
jgi:F-type H+-transporting ATPase subunit delta